MKTFAALILVTSMTTAWAADPAAAPPSPAASGAPLATTPAKPASAPATSPAVQASKNADQPGKVRPKNAVVPQISMTLPGAKPADPSLPSTGAAVNKPDDRAAACAAHVTKQDRDKCERSL